jgi:hypothetical protein
MPRLLLFFLPVVLPTVITTVVGGCASQASHFNADIVSSGTVCNGRPFMTKVREVQCYDLAERPVILKDLPTLLSAYELWHSARLSAASEYDNEVRPVQAQADALLRSRMDAASKRLDQAVKGIWPEAQGDKDLLKQEADRASSQCKNNGIWKSTSMVANIKCDQDAREPIFERRVPAATNALRISSAARLVAGLEYDQAVLPVIQAAGVKFGTTIAPAKSTFRSQVQLALQSDAAATARQQQEIVDLLSALAQVGIAGANAHQSYGQPGRPLISTSCTTTGGITNCLSF